MNTREAMIRAIDALNVQAAKANGDGGIQPDYEAAEVLRDLLDNRFPANPIARGQYRMLANDLDDAFYAVKDVVIRKNADYGDAWRRHGIVGVLIRISDKALRLQTLANGQQALVTDERAADTLLDIAGYALLGMTALPKE